MLLILSDFIKSLWFVIFPLVDFATGTVASTSAFCQASGFFLATGIESSDVAVILITLHTMLYIFRPWRSSGEQGLYPYRHVAYAIYLGFPVFVASLCFIDGTGYQNRGHYCYLSRRGGERRMALSWIPRYVVFAFLVVSYVCMYWYVRYEMREMERCERQCSEEEEEDLRRGAGGDANVDEAAATAAATRASRQSRYSVPIIKFQGLIKSSVCPSRSSKSVSPSRSASPTDIAPVSESKEGIESRTGGGGSGGGEPMNGTEPDVEQQPEVSLRPVQWNWTSFNQSSHNDNDNDDKSNHLSGDNNNTILPGPTPMLAPPPAVLAWSSITADDATPRRSVVSSQTTVTESILDKVEEKGESPPPLPPLKQERSGDNNISGPDTAAPNAKPAAVRPKASRWDSVASINTIVSALIRGSTTRTTARDESAVDQDVPNHCTTLQDDRASKRDKLRRQLRALFAYPLVYMATWIFPFISHVMGCDDSLDTEYPLWLLIVSITSLSMQGTVNCSLFMWRERPWQEARAGFWKSLGGMIRERCSLRRWRRASETGRTREEMVVDERNARRRRQEEMAAELAQRARSASRQNIEWWDAELAAEDDGDGEGGDDDYGTNMRENN